MRIVVHKMIQRRPRPDWLVIHTLCGRESSKSKDGMNGEDDWNLVTCKFCLKKKDVQRTALPHNPAEGRNG